MHTILQKPLRIALLGTALIFVVNLVFPSQLNGFQPRLNLSPAHVWDSPHADESFYWRSAHSVFSRRPVTLFLQKMMFDAGIPFGGSFAIIVLSAYFFSGLLIYRLALFFGTPKAKAGWAAILFYLCFSNVYAFLGNIFAYDDPLQYFLVLLSLWLFFRSNKGWSVVFFAIACLARETSFLLLPFFFLWERKTDKRLIVSVLMAMVSVGVYVFFLLKTRSPEMWESSRDYLLHDRIYHWAKNFGSFERATESVYCLFLVAALPFWVTWKSLSRQSLSRRLIFQYACFVLVVNSALTFFGGLAREARLFALPLLLIWPVSGDGMAAFIVQIRQNMRALSRREWAAILLVSMLVSFGLYQPSIGRTGLLFQAYSFIYLVVLGLGVYVPRRRV